MKTDKRPYWVKKNYLRFRHWYTEFFLRPECASLGRYHTVMKPWHTVIAGDNIHHPPSWPKQTKKCASVYGVARRAWAVFASVTP